MSLRTIIVDDSILFRKVMRDCIAEIKSVDVVDHANNGQTALEKILRIRPDLVTLDHEMPIMNGIEVLEKLRAEGFTGKVILVSSMADKGQVMLSRAIELGAYDYILKPKAENPMDGIVQLRSQLAQKILPLTQEVNKTPPPRPRCSPTPKPIIGKSPKTAAKRTHLNEVEAIFIGISTGGPAALTSVLPQLKSDFNLPVVIVQHMASGFTESLAQHLDSISGIRVCEAQDSAPMEAGCAYIAPGGRHLHLRRQGHGMVFRVGDEAPLNNCRPSVDLTMRSMTACLGGRYLAMILTGMGDDGLAGCQRHHQNGGIVWSQDQASSVVYGMPRCIAEAGLSHRIISLDQVASQLNALNFEKQEVFC